MADTNAKNGGDAVAILCAAGCMAECANLDVTREDSWRRNALDHFLAMIERPAARHTSESKEKSATTAKCAESFSPSLNGAPSFHAIST